MFCCKIYLRTFTGFSIIPNSSLHLRYGIRHVTKAKASILSPVPVHLSSSIRKVTTRGEESTNLVSRHRCVRANLRPCGGVALRGKSARAVRTRDRIPRRPARSPLSCFYRHTERNPLCIMLPPEYRNKIRSQMSRGTNGFRGSTQREAVWKMISIFLDSHWSCL